jgi:hypothetical protein
MSLSYLWAQVNGGVDFEPAKKPRVTLEWKLAV